MTKTLTADSAQNRPIRSAHWHLACCDAGKKCPGFENEIFGLGHFNMSTLLIYAIKNLGCWGFYQIKRFLVLDISKSHIFSDFA